MGQPHIFNTQNDMMVNQYRASRILRVLATNAVGGFSRDFWAEIDRQVFQLLFREVGVEIINDLIGVPPVSVVGKLPSCIAWSVILL